MALVQPDKYQKTGTALEDVKTDLRQRYLTGGAIEFYSRSIGIDPLIVDPLTEELTGGQTVYDVVSGIIQPATMDTVKYLGGAGVYEVGDAFFSTIYEYVVSGSVINYREAPYARHGSNYYHVKDVVIHDMYGENVAATFHLGYKADGSQGIE